MSDCEFFITYDIDVRVIRLIQNVLVPTDLSLTAHIDRGETATDAEIELAISKIRYWFDNVVSKTIAFGRDNTTAFDMLLDDDGTPRIGNIFMMVPDDPRDELLGALFQCKMNALANGALVVEAIDIRSDNLDGLSFSLLGDHAVYLPATMEEWLGAPSYFDVPWWLRNDASTLDVYLSEDSDKTKKPAWAFSLDFLDKTKKAAPGAEAAVVRPSFQPQVIKGGKDDPE